MLNCLGIHAHITSPALAVNLLNPAYAVTPAFR
jgi:hypothetical protein